MLLLQLYLGFHYAYWACYGQDVSVCVLPTFMYDASVSATVSRVARFAVDTYNLSGSPFLLALRCVS